METFALPLIPLATLVGLALWVRDGRRGWVDLPPPISTTGGALDPPDEDAELLREALKEHVRLEILDLDCYRSMCHEADLYIETDTDAATFTFATERTREAIGREIAGMDVALWLEEIADNGTDDQRTEDYWEKYREGGSQIHFVNWIRHADGSWREVHWVSGVGPAPRGNKGRSAGHYTGRVRHAH